MNKYFLILTKLKKDINKYLLKYIVHFSQYIIYNLCIVHKVIKRESYIIKFVVFKLNGRLNS